ncbi:MAG: hypothetical protein M3375_00285 [Actinomycetota bacterium]|nr:hypothetical protein [Actinomycetota bacterium]
MGLLLAPTGLFALLVPALLAGQSSNSAVRTRGTVISGVLFALAVVAIVVWDGLSRRPSAAPATS